MASPLLERLLSHAAAGPSSVCARDQSGHRLAPSKWSGPQGLHSTASTSRRGSSLATSGQVTGGRRRGGSRAARQAPTTRCQALQAADYSFYQRLREGEVTEQYLWANRLQPLLGYLTDKEVTLVREALSLAFDAHSGQRRKSGEPFITHPVEVARILAELRMDCDSLVAGLLHDTVEDCGDVVGLEEIDFHFGPAVRRIVEGETKFSKLPTHHPEDRNSVGSGLARGIGSGPAALMAAQAQAQAQGSNGAGGGPAGAGAGAASSAAAAAQAQAQAQAAAQVQAAVDPKAQDLQFLFLAMTEEVRIIVVKLADRLHNMRTMASMPPAKQRRIAQETLQVFAPLARLLGLYSIKEELEELSFRYALPSQYDGMRRSMARLWEAQAPVVEAARRELQAQLEADPYLQARISGVRVEACRKSLYSSWRKLHEAGKSVKEVGDIAQLRVVLAPRTGADAVPLDYGSEKQLCYHVMGLVHTFWAPIPGSMKDYIATPKPNNYQSLHTTVVPTGLDVSSHLSSHPGPSSNGSNGASANGASSSPPAPTPALRRSSVQLLFPIEVQIRTEEMNKLAENGIAIESWSSADFNWRVAGGGKAGGGSSMSSMTSMSTAGGSLDVSSNGSGSGSSSSSWEEEEEEEEGALEYRAGAGGAGAGDSSGSEDEEGRGEGRAARGQQQQQQRLGNGAVGSNGSSNGAGPGEGYSNGGGGGVLSRFPFNLGSLMASLAGSSPSSSKAQRQQQQQPLPASQALAGSSSSNGAAPPASATASSSSSSNGRVGGGSDFAVLSPAGGSYLSRNGSSRDSDSDGEGDSSIDPQVLSRRINWLKSIREWQSEFVGTLTASEFVECITDDLLGQSVFVFTPSGEVVRLPKGATVVDFAYHIHTEMGNTMVAAKVNGKVVNADHELQNAEVVEVVRYRGPVNATIIKRHQQWLDAAQTRTARHKIAKFLRQHAAMAVSKGLKAPGDSGLVPQCAPTDFDAAQVTWLVLQCDDRPGLLAEVANVIARHQHNITAYSGSADQDAGLFVMEYELEGRPSSLFALCEELSCIESVSSWATGCALPEQQQRTCI